jgi:hypothetical protein
LGSARAGELELPGETVARQWPRPQILRAATPTTFAAHPFIIEHPLQS